MNDKVAAATQRQIDRQELSENDIPFQMQDYDWQKIAPDVARQLLGEPKFEKSNEWRWNNKGSLVFTLETGQFYDFEEGEGGGVKWLIEKHGKDVSEVLKIIIRVN